MAGSTVATLRRFRSRTVQPRLVWIFGSPRSGSTWLMRLLCGHDGTRAIREPLIGAHLGLLAAQAAGLPPAAVEGRPRMLDFRSDEDYFFSSRYAKEWTPSLRRLLCERLYAQLGERGVGIVNEPNGSEGADVLMSALPRSHMVFLVRDGRDVVDSILDAQQPGSWLDKAFGVGGASAFLDRAAFVEEQAHRWTTRTTVVSRAYDAHAEDRRHLVRYEDLLADTHEAVRGLYRSIWGSCPTHLDRHVDALAYSAVPTEWRGSGGSHRAATPGLWRTNLTADEQKTCGDVMGAALARFGYPAA